MKKTLKKNSFSQNARRRNFLFNQETLDALKKLVENVNKNLNITLKENQAVQVLIRGAAQNPKQFFEWLTQNK